MSELLLSNEDQRFKGKRKYMTIYALEGFNSDCDKIQITKNLIIKRATLKFRNEFYQRGHGMGTRQSLKDLQENEFFLYHYTEVKIDDRREEHHDFMDRFRQMFRIYQEGDIEIRFYEPYCFFQETNKYACLGFHSNASNFWYVGQKYVINRDQKNHFKKFATRFLAFDYKKPMSLNVAMRRFDFSCKRIEWEDQIIDFMIAFEALFSRENGELTFRLSLRVAQFLSKYYDKKMIMEFMKKCYGLRSSIVHGVPSKTHIKFNGKDLHGKYIVTDLRMLLRLSIMLCVRKYDSGTVSSLIDDIDEAVIS